MNKTLLAGMLAALPGAMMAQSALDAYSVSQNDLRGSARFMSMGGAFTALGGDISTLNQNPGGIGVYRSSDLSATLDITMQSAKFRAGGMTNTENHTNVACNSFGYVGTVNLGSNSAMPTSWLTIPQPMDIHPAKCRLATSTARISTHPLPGQAFLCFRVVA